MKIQVISDTHGYHSLMRIEEGIDCLIHCGDSTNQRNLFNNEIEFEDFFEWFDGLVIPNKIIIAGNHDTWALKKYNKDKLAKAGIIYLEDSLVEIDGKTFYGSPWTPNFGNWNFMRDRARINTVWEMMRTQLEKPLDVLITHGPPKGVLDLSFDKDHILENCGDYSLFRHVMNIKPKYHCFGHIHDNSYLVNHGTRNIDGINFVNASAVTDGKFGKISYNGHTFEI